MQFSKNPESRLDPDLGKAGFFLDLDFWLDPDPEPDPDDF